MYPYQTKIRGLGARPKFTWLGDNKHMMFMRCSMQSANKDRDQPPGEAVEGKLVPPEATLKGVRLDGNQQGPKPGSESRGCFDLEQGCC